MDELFAPGFQGLRVKVALVREGKPRRKPKAIRTPKDAYRLIRRIAKEDREHFVVILLSPTRSMKFMPTERARCGAVSRRGRWSCGGQPCQEPAPPEAEEGNQSNSHEDLHRAPQEPPGQPQTSEHAKQQEKKNCCRYHEGLYST